MVDRRRAQVVIDLERVRHNTQAVRQRAGVDVLAVIKADAYGLGAKKIAHAIGDLVSEFCVFSIEEARALAGAGGKNILVLGPPLSLNADAYIEYRCRPAVYTAAQAGVLAKARPILSVDTGMQRFCCPGESIAEVIEAGGIEEAFTHAMRPDQVHRLVALLAGRKMRLHAAGSGLLDDPACRLDAVRPGLALYEGAVRVSIPLVEVRASREPAGYGGFASERHGVILVGYAQGLHAGPCRINGTDRRLLEVGMQSSFVEVGPTDKAGDEVVLLGDGLTEARVAGAWSANPRGVLLRFCAMANPQYRGV